MCRLHSQVTEGDLCSGGVTGGPEFQQKFLPDVYYNNYVSECQSALSDSIHMSPSAAVHTDFEPCGSADRHNRPDKLLQVSVHAYCCASHLLQGASPHVAWILVSEFAGMQV